MARIGRAFLVGGTVLLVANSAYLATADGGGRAYLTQVLLHPLLGLLLAPPFYLWWSRRQERRGWAGAGAILASLSLFCGLVLPTLDMGGARGALVVIHIALAIAGLLALLVALWKRGPIAAPTLFTSLLVAGVIGWLLGLSADPRAGEEVGEEGWSNRAAPASMADEAQGGAEGPFYPSSAATADGALLPAALFADNQQLCGRCHAAQQEEWAASAHAHSGLDNPFFAHGFRAAMDEVGSAAGRYCAGCHMPGALLTGELDAELNGKSSALAAQGIACTVCHAGRAARGTLGQGGYVLGGDALTLLASRQDGFGRALHDLLLRLDPESHARAFSPTVLQGELASVYCSTCHVGHVSTPVGDGRYFETFNDYDPWQGSAESGQGTVRSLYSPEPRSCVDCHMPPAEHGGRSHRFPGANTALPALAGDAAQLDAVRAAMADEQVTLDLFALIPEGAAGADEAGGLAAEEVFAPLDQVEAAARRGDSALVEVVVRPRAVGHAFPGGKRDLHEIWLELTVRDEAGRTLLGSGLLAEDGELDPAAHVFRARWIDAEGRRVEGHHAWKARAVVYDQNIEAATAHVAHYRIAIPRDASGERLTLRARLLHRKFTPDFARQALAGHPAEGMAPELPVTVMAEATAEIGLLPAGAPPPAPATWPATAPAQDWRRWNDYGIGRALQGDLRGSQRAFERVAELAPRQPDGWANLGRLAAIAGNLEAARENLARALEIQPKLARSLHFLGITARNEGNFDEALTHFRAAAELFPRERLIPAQIGSTLFQQGELAPAAEQFQRVLAIDPSNAAAHFNLARIYRALGEAERADHHQARFDRFKADETVQALVLGYLQDHPHDNLERQRIHVHETSPPTNSSTLAAPGDSHPAGDPPS